ncbi:MAG: bifunctional DNA-formamidopyrimidine glycosylase/DNA-(apurinic or apyrimidinic site) lyase [bacterium]
MPEMPEVETIKRDLEKKVRGKRIERVIIKNKKSVKLPTPAEFIRRIEGKVFSRMERRGKFLLLGLNSEDHLIIHLKLTGRLIYSRKGEELDYTRVVFVFKDNTQLSFTDVRGFGGIWLISDREFQMLPALGNLGPEPLAEDFTVTRFKGLLKGKRGKIKSLLMDQEFIAGIGNIYSQEALFPSQIHPERSPSSLADEEIEKLYKNLRQILKKAISYRGSSVNAYVDLEGKKGNFESQLKVYGREGKACFKCGTIIKRIDISGRGTYFCPSCQS